ncbi:MAG: DedA family protein, partial [Candidatus Zixiibacteriota bacterium]
MSDSIQAVNAFLDNLFVHGPWLVYLVILVACFIENIFPPFPGDSFIVAAGALVGLGRLQLIPALLTVICGGMASVMVLYWFGRRYGRDFFWRRDFKYFSRRDIEAVEKRLARWGGGILVISRFVVGIRAALAVAAGIGRYSSVRMFIYSTISYLLFAGLLMYIAVSLVENLEVIER